MNDDDDDNDGDDDYDYDDDDDVCKVINLLFHWAPLMETVSYRS